MSGLALACNRGGMLSGRLSAKGVLVRRLPLAAWALCFASSQKSFQDGQRIIYIAVRATARPQTCIMLACKRKARHSLGRPSPQHEGREATQSHMGPGRNALPCPEDVGAGPEQEEKKEEERAGPIDRTPDTSAGSPPRLLAGPRPGTSSFAVREQRRSKTGLFPWVCW